MSTVSSENNWWIYTFSSQWSTLADKAEVDAALLEKSESFLSGRKPVYFIMLNNKKCVLRFFHHGGILRNVFKDSFWEKQARAIKELELLEYFLKQGLDVVKPVLAGRTAGSIYRQFIVTEYEENAVDLNNLEDMDHDFLFRLFDTLDLFFENGLYHPDLNIKNIMVTENKERIILLDFDKAGLIRGGIPVHVRQSMVERLFRSFDKSGKLKLISDLSFRDSRDYIEKAYHSYSKKSGFRSLLWIFNKK